MHCPCCAPPPPQVLAHAVVEPSYLASHSIVDYVHHLAATVQLPQVTAAVWAVAQKIRASKAQASSGKGGSTLSNSKLTVDQSSGEQQQQKGQRQGQPLSQKVPGAAPAGPKRARPHSGRFGGPGGN